MAYAIRDQGVAFVGFQQLNAALQRVAGGKADFGLEYELQHRLKLIGEHVAAVAPSFVTHKTGRHGSPEQPRLEDSVKVSVTQRSASVFSRSVYGGVQNVGGRVGRNRATLLRRDEVSQWMIKTVAAERDFVREQLDGLLDWLIAEFEAG